MSGKQRPSLNKNVSPNWKPVAQPHPPGMLWSDRIAYWLVSLGGLVVVAIGIAVMAYLRLAKVGGLIIGLGWAIFIVGSPGQAARNGYRHL